jgi:peptidoglycan/LPS O-acetylase OafA/YrhL
MTVNKLTDEQSLFLDIVRLFLAIVVVIGHSFGFFLNYFDGFFPNYFPHPQSIAVVCFFYLSGFLIVGSQINQKNNGQANLYKYLFDRGVRIYTTLIPSLLFVAVADYFINKSSLVKIDLISNFATIDIFLKNLLLLPSMPFGTMRPIWSLMYEWWIYLLFGGFFFLKTNKISAAILIVIGAHYTFGVNAAGESGHIWIVWLLGGFCAYFHQKTPEQFWMRHKLGLDVLASLLLVAALLMFFLAKSAYYLPAGISLSLFIFFVTIRTHKKLSHLNVRLVRVLAGMSFTLFITHYTVLTFAKEVVGLSGWLGLWVGFLLSTLAAFVIAYFTELRLKIIKNFIRDNFLRRFAVMSAW